MDIISGYIWKHGLDIVHLVETSEKGDLFPNLLHLPSHLLHFAV
jgi:hypothetical protein